MWYFTMKLTFGSILSLKIKYTYIRGNTTMYQRKIPTDLVSRYDGAIHIKKNLETTDPASVAKLAQALNQHYDSLWESMRRDQSITPQGVRAEAIKILATYSLRPFPANNTPDNVDDFIRLVVEPKREAAANGDEYAYRHNSPEHYLSASETEALRILRNPPQFTLDEALDLFLKLHDKAHDESFVRYTRRTWSALTLFLGNKAVIDVTRDDANAFVAHLLKAGDKTTTIRRKLNSIRPVFNRAIREKSLNTLNHFQQLQIPSLGHDALTRESFTLEELKAISSLCIQKDDDLRWLIALQLDTGARLAELVGIELSDLNLDDAIPFINIEPKTWRSLKTANSARQVPLVGLALWAAKRLKDTATPNQRFAFPRYTSESVCKSTHASSSLNSWLKAQGFNKTTHSFRHSVRDRLRNVDATKDVQDSIGGWARHTPGERYGRGPALHNMHRWLEKIVLASDRS